MIKAFQIRIYGKVQGVFFRASAQAEALKLGRTSFAKNTPDDSVYIGVEGEEDRLNVFIDWCKKGPPLATVSKIEIQKNEVLGYNGFQIRR